MIGLAIAAPATGAGKTTATIGLAAAFRRRGLRVQAFKAGPDYLDPTYHARATGRPGRNLDTWMVGPDELRELFWRATAEVDLALVEGMMGLFDGRGADEAGSTAHLAKLLGIPVLVMIDVGGTSRTAGAIALGCQRFDPDLAVAGFLLNHVGGERHRAWVSEAIQGATGLPVLGALPKRAELSLPERHLGLIPAAERPLPDEFFDRLADLVESICDLNRILALARPIARPAASLSGLFPSGPVAPVATIGVAVDEAFGFYYEDNLDLLRAHGARLATFSPLRDAGLPEGVDALYLGGGFPEVFAAQLAANQSMRAAIRSAAAAGMPIYAECGGLMYLSEGITDLEGTRHPMVGLVPGWTTLANRRLTLGYRELRARVDTPALRRGQVARGHEFHWSRLEAPLPAEAAAYDVLDAPVPTEGFALGNLLASYCHLHFGSNPVLAPNFVEAGKGWREKREG